MPNPREYIDLYLAEGRRHLGAMEQALLALERRIEDRAAIEKFFRAAHTLKGMAGAMGFDATTALAHTLEEFMLRFREGGEAFTPEAADLSLAAVDVLRGQIDKVALGADAPDPAPPAVIDALTHFARPVGAAPPAGPDLIGVEDTAPDSGPGPASDGAPPPQGALAAASPATAASPARSVVLDASLPTPAQILAELTAPLAPRSSIAGTGLREVRVAVDELSEMSDLVLELATAREELAELLNPAVGSAAHDLLEKQSRLVRAIEDRIGAFRRVPLGVVTARLPRLVRTMARQLERELDIVIDGDRTEVDSGLAEALAEPLTHLVRNATDHGIEKPDDRAVAGKDRAGRVELRFSLERDRLIVTVADDGRGIDPDAVYRRAVERGLISEAQGRPLAWETVVRLLCTPGFSTTDTVTEFSGRGVGLDAVANAVTALGGRMSVTSRLGYGTRVVLSLPTATQLRRVLVVEEGPWRLGIPMPDALRVDPIEGSALTSYAPGPSGRPLDLSRVGLTPGPRSPHDKIVVIDVGGIQYSLRVQNVIGVESLAVRPLAVPMRGRVGLLGSAVSTGSVPVFVLNMPWIVGHLA